MNLVFFVGLFLSIKYSNEKPFSDDEFKSYSDKTVKINLSNLSPRCEGCCDDLNDDYELKETIETRLDLNYFNNREALKRRETNIYNEMKICVHERPLLSCVDLCLCETETCIRQHISRARILHEAYHCTKKKLETEFGNKQITLSDQTTSKFKDCWFELNKEEISKLLHKFWLNQETEDQTQNKSLEPNSTEQSDPLPITTNNSSNLFSLLPKFKLIIIIWILKQFIFQLHF